MHSNFCRIRIGDALHILLFRWYAFAWRAIPISRRTEYEFGTIFSIGIFDLVANTSAIHLIIIIIFIFDAIVVENENAHTLMSHRMDKYTKEGIEQRWE